MSQENVEAARRLYDARNRGDMEAVIAECHPEVEWRRRLPGLAASRYEATTGFAAV